MNKRSWIGLLSCSLLVACTGGGGGGGGPAASSGTTTPATASPAPTPTPAPAPAPAPAPTPAPAPATAGVVKLLTYNVAGLPMIISTQNPLRNNPLISPKLNAYELVLVQEDFAYHDLLTQDVQHPFKSIPLTQVSTFVADGLNRFSNTPFTPVDRHKWDSFHGVFNDGADGLSSKGFSMGRHTLAPGIEVDVYNIHADAGRDPGDRAARHAQYIQLTDYIQANSAGRAIIVAGDTNLHVSDLDDELILQSFLNSNGLTDSARFLGATPELLDRVMFRSSATLSLEPLNRRVASEMVDSSGARLSDHYAINVDMLWQVVP